MSAVASSESTLNLKYKVRYPCRNCVYFDVCGLYLRTEPCSGRMTKRQQKKAKVSVSES